MKLPHVIGWRSATVIVALLGLELALRPFGWGQWTVNELSARYGWRMLPHQDAWSRDLDVPEHINAWGFRDREWDPPRKDADGRWVKDESVFRVAVVGNSMTFGTSVPIEDTWPRVLEDELQRDFAARGVTRRPVVMNFAVQGYVFEQMARVYEDIASQWRPDLLIVPTHPHDITPMKPSTDDIQTDFRPLILRTAVYDLLQTKVVNRWVPAPPAPQPPPWQPGDPRPDTETTWSESVDKFITDQPFNASNNRFWNQMEQRLDQVRVEVERDGGRLVVVTLPRFRDIFEPKLLKASHRWIPWTRARPDTLHIEPLPDLVAPMEPLRQEILDKGLPPNATHDFSTLRWKDADGVEHAGNDLEHAGESLFLLRDTGHYTAAGHHLIGQAVARALKAAGWTP